MWLCFPLLVWPVWQGVFQEGSPRPTCENDPRGQKGAVTAMPILRKSLLYQVFPWTPHSGSIMWIEKQSMIWGHWFSIQPWVAQDIVCFASVSDKKKFNKVIFWLFSPIIVTVVIVLWCSVQDISAKPFLFWPWIYFSRPLQTPCKWREPPMVST